MIGRKLSSLTLSLGIALSIGLVSPSPATEAVTSTNYYAYTYMLNEPKRAKNFPATTQTIEVNVPNYAPQVPRLAFDAYAGRDGVGVNGVKVTLTGTASRLDASGNVIDVLPFDVQGRTGRGGYSRIEALVGQILNGERYRMEYQARARGRKPLTELTLKSGLISYVGCTPTATRACFGSGQVSAEVMIGNEVARLFESNATTAVFFVTGVDVELTYRDLCQNPLGLLTVETEVTPAIDYQVILRNHRTGQAANVKSDKTGSALLKCAIG